MPQRLRIPAVPWAANDRPRGAGRECRPGACRVGGRRPASSMGSGRSRPDLPREKTHDPRPARRIGVLWFLLPIRRAPAASRASACPLPLFSSCTIYYPVRVDAHLFSPNGPNALLQPPRPIVAIKSPAPSLVVSRAPYLIRPRSRSSGLGAPRARVARRRRHNHFAQPSRTRNGAGEHLLRAASPHHALAFHVVPSCRVSRPRAT